MGKRIIQQRRGRGTFTYRVKRNAYRHQIKYPSKLEGEGTLHELGPIVDEHSSIRIITDFHRFLSRLDTNASKEIKLALQECGRRLSRYIRKGQKAREEAKKRSYIEQYIPHIGIALQEILSFSDREEQKVVDKLKRTLERSRKN